MWRATIYDMATKKTTKKKATKKKYQPTHFNAQGIPQVGRPPKYKTVQEIQAAIDAYFASCFEPVMQRQLKADAALREAGKPKHEKQYTVDDYEWIQQTDWAGEPIYRQVLPFTICGLALSLGMTREGLRDYGNKDKFADTIKKAKLIIQEYTERQLFKPQVAAGVIFNLKNNYGWSDKQEVELDAKENLASLVAASYAGNKRSGEET